MKKYLIVVMCLIVSSLSQAQKIQDFSLDDIENNSKSFESLKGEKLTLVDFWATWCKPCLKAIPELVKIQDEYKAKGLNVIGISVDGPRSVNKVSPLVKTMHVNYPVLLDFNNDIMRNFNVSSLPSLFIINQDNKIVYFHEGFSSGDEKEIREKIDSYLSK